MKCTPVCYGVVGLGRSGWSIHIAQLRQRDDAKVVAVADPDVQRRAEAVEELGCSADASLAKLLQRDDVEVVVLATPSHMHCDDAIATLEAGKHVVVEKPMAMNVEQCDRMIEAAERNERQLFVHQNLRFSPEFNFIMEQIDSGRLGRVFFIRHHTAAFKRRNDWQTLRKFGGGALNNTATHMLDQLLPMLGSPVRAVMADLQQIASAGDAEDHVKVMLRAENGCTADVEISSAIKLPQPLPKWTVCGTHGTLVSDGQNATINWFDPASHPPLEVKEGPAEGRSYDNADRIDWQSETVPARTDDPTTFYDNVAAVLRECEPMRVTPQSVREMMRVIEMIRQSIALPS